MLTNGLKKVLKTQPYVELEKIWEALFSWCYAVYCTLWFGNKAVDMFKSLGNGSIPSLSFYLWTKKTSFIGK